MKDLILLLMITLSIDLFSQNTIDPPNLFLIQNDSLHQDTGILNGGPQTKFIIGWNWSSLGVKLDDALNINTYHDYDISHSATDCRDSLNVIQSFHTILCNQEKNLPFTALSLYLNPTITVDSTKHFKPRPYNNDGAIFGFCNKNKVRILDSNQHTDSEYPFAILNKDSVPYGTSTLVLSNVWKKDALHYLNKTTDVSTNTLLNGERFYLTINLKSNEAIPDSLRDSVILSIKLPYTFHHEGSADTYDSVKFSYFPQFTNNLPNDTVRIIGDFGDNRGIARKTPTTGLDANSKVWQIRGRDLIADVTASGNNLITLSAFIKFTAIQGENPRLFPEWYQHPTITEYITNIDMEVRYHGHLNTSIQFLRFETPQAQKVFRGQYDRFVDTTIHSILVQMAGHPRHPKLFRFYAEDEFIPMLHIMMEWVI